LIAMENSRLALAFAAGACLSGGVFLLWARSRRGGRDELPDAVLLGQGPAARSGFAACAAPVSVREFAHDEVLLEQLTRNVQFFGMEAQQSIADSFVVVVGLGVGMTRGMRLVGGRRSRQRRSGRCPRRAHCASGPAARTRPCIVAASAARPL
jgi:hypothetical protein